MNRIAIVLDKSGSMATLANDTIGGFNKWLTDLQNSPEHHAKVTLTLFDSTFTVLYKDRELTSIPVLTTKDYVPSGSTALNDALGTTLDQMEEQQNEGDRVLVLVITDGEENSSKQFTKAQLKARIEKLTAEGWEFVFLGANIDAFSEAGSYGINQSTQYSPTSGGTYALYGQVTNSTADWAKGSAMAMPSVVPDPDAEPVTPTTK